jgi:hypothetical protein
MIPLRDTSATDQSSKTIESEHIEYMGRGSKDGEAGFLCSREAHGFAGWELVVIVQRPHK